MKRGQISMVITKACLQFACLACGYAVFAADPFEDVVRKTEPLTPQQEQKTFHLPPGFVIELVASEPQISKPMNMAFDARGRLWITQSREYPFPVLPPEKPGRDEIKVLEQFSADGRAQKVTTFATGLNIPIGLYPHRDGVLGFSIPNIYNFSGVKSSGQARPRELVLGPFGFDRDTHGLTSSFRRGYDGWIYADHGFNNNTTLTGADGSSIFMNSGNCYRFRLDGSHVEYHSHGQVNPFGLMFDPWGDLWSADCHSAPVYQLLRGAYYPSFGKPHDGLGFAPSICAHSHGSTAIAGIIFYAADSFPAEYQHNIFVGNVMTCRINRDSLVEHGSTRLAKEEPDFLSSDDPWFRPVDLQLGPDGAIYVADFYNRIIGHYEVPLTHPGRDRERGRIWRIRLEKNRAPAAFDLSHVSPSAAVAELNAPNIARRMLAMNFLVDEGTAETTQLVRQNFLRSTSEAGRAHSLWILHRLKALDETALGRALADRSPIVRVHAFHVLADIGAGSASQIKERFIHEWLDRGLNDGNAYVRRAAADAIGFFPAPAHVNSLLALMSDLPAGDLQLEHVAKMALRDQLRIPGAFSSLKKRPEREREILAQIALGVTNAEAASFLLDLGTTDPKFFRHIARYGNPADIDRLAEQFVHGSKMSVDDQLSLFKAVEEGGVQRGGRAGRAVLEWGASLAMQLFRTEESSQKLWSNVPLESARNAKNPWILQKRKCADGTETTFLSSLPPGGESLTGLLKSMPFVVPAKLKFYLVGHDGPPEKAPQGKNLARLRLSESGEVIAQSPAPRSDTAQLQEWDLPAHVGKNAVFELVDADEGAAYAWIGVARFNPPVLRLPQAGPSLGSARMESALELVRSLKLSNLWEHVRKHFADASEEVPIRIAGARALFTLDPSRALSEVGPVVKAQDTPSVLRETLIQVIGEASGPSAIEFLTGLLASASAREQRSIALGLAGTGHGADMLLQAIESGKASPRLLQQKPVMERLKGNAPEARITKLTANLAPANEAIRNLLESRRRSFNPVKADRERGAKVFEKNCMACHQVEGRGAVVGPQLDGVGNRGLERLAEDVLDPNQNVDRAFRYSTITLKDDSVITGLQRREEGASIVFADSTGKEIIVRKSEIKERVESENSLMPDNFGEVLTPDEFNDLMGFLLAQKK